MAETLFDYGGVGQILITPGAQQAFETAKESPLAYLKKHITLDWGDVPEADKETNNRALKAGGRVLSAYKLSNDVKVWIITEAMYDGVRETTTILLPEEY